MVKQVLFEESNVQYFKELSGSQGCIAGLLTGQVTTNKDYTARPIRCPTQVAGDELKEWDSVKDVDGSWIAGHASQVLPSLPGGISVIGLFIIARSTESKLAMEKLKQTLYQTYRLVSKTCDEIKAFLGTCGGDESSLFWTVMHVDSSNGNIINCRQYDVRDNKDSGRPVEVKEIDNPIQWDCVEATLHIDNSSVMSTIKSGKEISRTAETFCERVGRAHVLIDGVHRQGTGVLNQSHGVQINKGAKKKRASTLGKALVAQTYSCQIFIPTGQVRKDDSCDQGSIICACGTVSAKAYLCPGSTISESTYALKYDIIQSMQQRCTILSECLNGSEKDDLAKSLPRRVYVKDQRSKNVILFSEYILPFEPLEDCLERFKDNLDIKVEPEQLLEPDCEERFDRSESEQNSADAECVPDYSEEPTDAASKTNAILAIVATAVAAVAWIVSGLVLHDN